MYRNVFLFVFVAILLAPFALAGPIVTNPKNGSTVSPSARFSATAGSTSCAHGVASMGIYTGSGQLAHVSNGTSLNTTLTLAPGTYNTVVQQWDYCGGASSTAIRITVTNKTGVFVTSPANSSAVSSDVHFVATATTPCSKGVAAMGIYTAPYQKAYVVNGGSLDTVLTLSSGTYNAAVTAWDNCGGASSTPVAITVSAGKTLSDLQAKQGWKGYGELPPKYDICSNCGSGLSWSMTPGITSPSVSGKAAKFTIAGSVPYADILWNNHLIGDGSSQGMPDSSHSLVQNLHNFTYDAYFYGTNLSLSENIEFDIAQFFHGMGFMYGTQCQIVNGQVWGIWNPAAGKWVPTSIPCKPNSNAWNHVIIRFERTSGNQLLYRSITLNGITSTINKTYSPFSAPSGWWGVAVNFQLDGDYKLSDYSVYVDKLNVTYN